MGDWMERTPIESVAFGVNIINIYPYIDFEQCVKRETYKLISVANYNVNAIIWCLSLNRQR